MKSTNCPSCGAPVVFRSAASILAVCEYCKSTLIRHDMDLENLGKMAELLEDASPLQVGAEGRYKGSHYAVIGRIQLRYQSGVWNEWHLLFDNGNSGWLSEASGNYVMTFPSAAPEAVPPFEQLKPGQTLSLHGQTFQVTDLETSTCIAGEGELPFKVGAGYEAPLADLANQQNFATLDYSESPPLLFVGEQVELATLAMTGLRSREAAAGKTATKAFNCPSCGSPLEIRAKGSESVACASCGSVIDVANENHQILSRFRIQTRFTPLLALGTRGSLRGADYDVVGYLRRRVTVEDVPYEWSEYLLYGDKEGFRWLSEYQGHWNFIKTTTRVPKVTRSIGKPKAFFLGTTYVHFQTAVAEVTYVVGEFYWRVKVGEKAEIWDYVAPPLMLSEERGETETVWSLGEYLPAEDVAAAFKPATTLPQARGVYANQPSPYTGQGMRYFKAFMALALLAFCIQLVFLLFSGSRPVLQQDFSFSPGEPTQTLTTEPFQLSGHPTNLVIRNRTNLNNNWLYLNLNLIDTGNGTSRRLGREISYYHGYDGGESWSEGNAKDEVVLSDVPPGNYILQIDPEAPPEIKDTIVDRLQVISGVPGWTNFFLALLGLAVFPLLAGWRGISFERRRWAESDYASTDSGSDDD